MVSAPDGHRILVAKFGGTSVAGIDRMRNVADIVADERRGGRDLVVVVSAMAGETNRLIGLAQSAVEELDPRELDCMVATGEQVSAALIAMILRSKGIPARSILGYQMGLKTTGVHTRARIVELERATFERAFSEGVVLVAAGFQGVDPEGDVTTLGRGGSDTTAVAIAAGLGGACDIYTDVDGVYTADPNIAGDARMLDKISYEEMLELASSGAKVLQIRSVELAMKYRVPLRVRSTFTRRPGTLVKEEDKDMESVLVAGVSLDRNEAKIALRGVPDVPGMASSIFTPLAEAHIVVDMIIQSSSSHNLTDITFTVPRTDLKPAVRIVEDIALAKGIRLIEHEPNVAKVSIVGVGMRSHAGVATRMFSALADEGINMLAISTSEIKVSVLIEEKYAELAVRALHKAFELHLDPRERSEKLLA
jgi:aspartate kinase